MFTEVTDHFIPCLQSHLLSPQLETHFQLGTGENEGGSASRVNILERFVKQVGPPKMTAAN